MSRSRCFRHFARRAGAASAAILVAASAATAQVTTDSLASVKPLAAVVVSATRTNQTVGTLPVQVSVLSERTIASTPAQTVPDLLRTIPGFSTRDLQAGLVSGPSQSIVSFRGLGGSSAGRTLVLLDGVPAGDPFSGWLDWGRIPLAMVAAAEVVRGGGSITWGSRSLGGVVNLRTLAPTRDEVRLTVEGGSRGTYHGAGAISTRRSRWSGTLGGAWQGTDGFVLLRPEQAGPVDQAEKFTNRSIAARTTFEASDALQLWIGGNTFRGEKAPDTDGDAYTFHEGRGGARWLAGAGFLTVTAYANRRRSLRHSVSINADRTVATPQRTATSPASSQGVSAQWTQQAGSHELSTGVDLTRAEGELTETYAFVSGQPTNARDVGGTQSIAGIFVQDAATFGERLRLVASARLDAVRNGTGRRGVRNLVQNTTLSDTVFRPGSTSRATYSLGSNWQAATWLSWRASVYESFRTPSMYEMYYPRFSSRGSVTESNAALVPERLRGVETGADVLLGSRLTARVTAFRSRVFDPILDVTIGTAGSTSQVIQPCGTMPARQTCAQRRNVEQLVSKGLETDVEVLAASGVSINGGYTYTPARIVAPRHPANGKQAIRSARHMANGAFSIDVPRWMMATLDARYVGKRFDDDVNTIDLAPVTLVGLRINRQLTRQVAAHIKLENLLNEEFEITRTSSGLADMGAPRWITVGLRATW